MSDRNTKVIEQVVARAQRRQVALGDLIKETKTVTVVNPVGFDFVCSNTRELLRRVIDSAKFGYDDPTTLHGFLAGCNARRTGFHSSFREIGAGSSLHIQVGRRQCNAHIDAIGITPARDSKGANVFDLSKIVQHWDRDLRPEMGALQNFDLTVLRGKSELTGTSQFGVVFSLRKKF